MRDFLFDYFGDRAASGTNLLGGRPGEIGTPGKGYATRVARGRTADDRISEIDLMPLPEDTRSPAYWSSPQQLDARTRVDPAMLQRAQQMAALDKARLAPVTPGAPAHGPAGWMPPGERGGAGVPPPMSRPVAPGGQAPPMNPPGVARTMPQQAGGGQPQLLLPSGQPEPARPNFLGRARDWLGGEAFPAGQGMSRGMVLAQMLGQFGAGLSATGRVGPGLQAANETMMGLRQSERASQQQDIENRYKMATAEAQLAKALKPAAGNSSEAERYIASLPPEQQAEARRRRLETLMTEGAPARTAEGVLVDPNATPEMLERAQAVMAAKDAPTEAEQERLRLAEQRDARAEAAARRAEEAGNRAAAASIRQENAARQKEEQDRMQAGVGLRKEFNSSPEVKAYRSIVAPIRSALESAGRNDRISDIDLVFALGKTFDPNSVVRESEQGMILEAQGVPDWIQGAVNSLTGEAKLQPAVRKQILATLKSRASGLRKSAEQQRQEYVGYAAGSRLKPDEVIPTLEELPDLPDAPGGGMTPAAADEHGTVQLGALQARIGQTATPEEKAQLPRANSREEALKLPAGQFFVGSGDVIGRR